MKKSYLLTAVLVAGSLASAASAATTAGLEVGYLTDNKDAYWSGRVGWVFNTGTNLSHQVELELGYTKHVETEVLPAPANTILFSAHTRLQPLTINYRGETTAADKLGFYYGVGVGQCWVHIDFPVSGGSSGDTAFAFQGFAGINYKVGPAATLHLGAKFLRVGNVDLSGSSIEVGNDTALTAGVSIRF